MSTPETSMLTVKIDELARLCQEADEAKYAAVEESKQLDALLVSAFADHKSNDDSRVKDSYVEHRIGVIKGTEVNISVDRMREIEAEVAMSVGQLMVNKEHSPAISVEV